MAFCGNCGILLPLQVMTCPRCGIKITHDEKSEHQHAYDATMISVTDRTELSKSSPSSKPGIIQGTDQFTSENSQTQKVTQHGNTPVLPFRQDTPSPALPEHYSQTIPPPPPPNSLPDGSNHFSTNQGTTYPSFHFPTDPRALPRQTKSRSALLVMPLLLFLVILTVVSIVFAVGPSRLLQFVRGHETAPQPTVTSSAPQPTATAPTYQPTTTTPTYQPTSTPTSTPEQQAQSVIDRYYTAINAKDYQTAYNLWVNYPDSYQKFANGFATTQHDDYQFSQITQQSNGTVQIWITLIATETSSRQKTYQGYYIIGLQPDGSWKIITGDLKAS